MFNQFMNNHLFVISVFVCDKTGMTKSILKKLLTRQVDAGE